MVTKWKTEVTATVSEKYNKWWAGKGIVLQFDVETGTVILKMISGPKEGQSGGFDIDKVKFKVIRTEVNNAPSV